MAGEMINSDSLRYSNNHKVDAKLLSQSVWDVCQFLKSEIQIELNEHISQTQSNFILPEIPNSPPFDLNSHQDNYVEFLKRINRNPRKIYLFEIIQQLLQIDPEKDDSAIWKSLENIVLHGKNGSKDNLINRPSQLQIEPPTVHLPPPPPLPPQLLASFSSPPPPPIPLKSSGPLGPQIYTTLKQPALDSSLPQQNPPAPQAKMKIICWDKIPSHEIVGGINLWTTLASTHQRDSIEYIDWVQAELLFCLQSSTSNNSVLTINRKSKIIKLLDSQRTFNIDILLEQFKGYKSDHDIVQLVYKGNHSAMGSEKISRLIKLLPEAEEIEVLKNFDGHRDCLARAEKFLQQLIDVPSYKLRLECMALKEEFTENVQGLQSSIAQLIQAGNDLMNNRNLHEVLYIIVLVGNFLNTGKYTGKAGGIRVTSLLKLTNIRANANNMNFMHFITDQIKKSHSELTNFPNDLQSLAKVNKINIEQLIIDVKKLDLRLQQVRIEIESPATENDIKQQMISFLLKAETQIDNLKTGVKNVKSMHMQLSKFLCEDSSKFSLSECFNIFQNFAENFTNALNERNEFDLKSTLRLKQKMYSGGGKPVQCATSEFDSIPEPPVVKKRFGKTNTKSNKFIQKEVYNLNKQTNDVKDINRYCRSTQYSYQSNDHTIQRLKRSDEIYLNTKETKQKGSNQTTGVSERIQKYLTNIESGKSENYQQKENTSQRSSKENPPRTSSFRLKYQENPSIPKFEKIGKRVSSITEQDLQEIIQKLRRKTKNEPSLWDIPREKLLEHIDCYHAAKDEDSLSHKEVSAKENSASAFTNKNVGLPDKSQTNLMDSTISRSIVYSNEAPSKLDSLKTQEKSKSLFERLTNKIRFYKRTKA